MAFAVVRVRGRVGVRRDIEEALKRLRLARVNHCVVVPETETFKGLIQKAKDFITWGEVDHDTLKELLLRKGEFEDGAPVTEETLKEKIGTDVETFVKKVLSGEIVLSHVGIKPFRLHPPSGGYERRGIKYPYTLGGALGYRGDAINALLRRMM